jgi:hypothetical protein
MRRLVTFTQTHGVNSLTLPALQPGLYSYTIAFENLNNQLNELTVSLEANLTIFPLRFTRLTYVSVSVTAHGRGAVQYGK